MSGELSQSLKNDLKSIFDRDPAARTTIELLLCYPGLHAIWMHRIAHWFWGHQLKLIARWISNVNRFITGVEIHPGAIIGSGFFIDHGMGVVIGETAEVGHNVTLYHGVTLGGVSLVKGKRHPTIEDDVVIGAGAKVMGAITIGRCSRIGANAVVVKSVPPDSVVVGVPGQVVRRSKPHLAPDLDHDLLPDTIGMALAAVTERLESLEKKVNDHETELANVNNIDGNGHKPLPHPEAGGVWRGEDFMI